MEAEERAQRILVNLGLTSEKRDQYTEPLIAEISSAIRDGYRRGYNAVEVAETEAWNAAVRALSGELAKRFDLPNKSDQEVRSIIGEVGLHLIKETP